MMLGAFAETSAFMGSLCFGISLGCLLQRIHVILRSFLIFSSCKGLGFRNLKLHSLAPAAPQSVERAAPPRAEGGGVDLEGEDEFHVDFCGCVVRGGEREARGILKAKSCLTLGLGAWTRSSKHRGADASDNDSRGCGGVRLREDA
jgi:hypothetical protein